MAAIQTLARPGPGLGPGFGRLLALPPALRQSVFQQQFRSGARPFSIPAIIESVPAARYVETTLALIPATVMESLASVGLPWYAVLPVSAVVFRSLLVYPLFQRSLRKKLAQRASIAPLIQAHLSLYKRQEMKDPRIGLNTVQRFAMVLHRWLATRRLEKNLFSRNALAFERTMSFLTLMTVSESIRRLSGSREGLLSVLMRPFSWILGPTPDAAPEQHPAQSTTSPPVQPTSHGLESEPASTSSSADAFTSADFNTLSTSVPSPDQILQPVASSPPLSVDSPWFEPALLTDGFSWCPDLTAADPTLTLPFVFSASFFANIYFAPRIADQHGVAKATNLQRIVMTVAIFSIYPALQMPSALLIYFTSNIWVSALQSRWLAYRFPVRPAPSACRRPVRMQPLKEMAEEQAGSVVRRRR